VREFVLEIICWKTENRISVMSDFHCEVDKNCALLGCYATSSGNFLPTFRVNLSVPSSVEDVTDRCFIVQLMHSNV